MDGLPETIDLGFPFTDTSAPTRVESKPRRSVLPTGNVVFTREDLQAMTLGDIKSGLGIRIMSDDADHEGTTEVLDRAARVALLP